MDPSPSPWKAGEERSWAQPRLSDVKDILSILICCDSLVQNMLYPLSWNSSYLNVWDFKEAERKILFIKCWSSGNDRTKAGGIFTYFSGCQSILHKGHHSVLKTWSTAHAKRPKCHWLWEVLLGYHHPQTKMVLYQQQFCAKIHNKHKQQHAVSFMPGFENHTRNNYRHQQARGSLSF